MTLLQMQYFKAVCLNGSVTHAAEELFVSRPAVSRLLSELERELGVMLFWRSSTGIALTEAGTLFYENCNDILNRVEALEKRMLEICEKGMEYLADRKKLNDPAKGNILLLEHDAVNLFKLGWKLYQG